LRGDGVTGKWAAFMTAVWPEHEQARGPPRPSAAAAQHLVRGGAPGGDRHPRPL